MPRRFVSVDDDARVGLLIKAADAAVAWAAVVQLNPFPVGGSPQETARAPAALTEAEARFVNALNRLSRTMDLPMACRRSSRSHEAPGPFIPSVRQGGSVVVHSPQPPVNRRGRAARPPPRIPPRRRSGGEAQGNAQTQVLTRNE